MRECGGTRPDQERGQDAMLQGLAGKDLRVKGVRLRDLLVPGRTRRGEKMPWFRSVGLKVEGQGCRVAG